MSDSNERSYYEIALTNAQVLVAFGILLVCVLGAFLSGMWVARTSLADRLAEEPDRTEIAAVGQDDELDFFDDDAAQGEESATPENEPEASSTAVATTSRQSTTTTSRSTTSAPATTTTTTAVADEAADAPTASTPSVPTAAEGSLVIQVFSSADEDQANRMIETLTGDGFAAFLSPVEVDDRTLFRVRVGPFENRSGAERVAEQLRRRHRLETWITGR